MIERALTLALALTLAVLAAAGVRYQLGQLNSALAARMDIVRTVAERR